MAEVREESDMKESRSISIYSVIIMYIYRMAEVWEESDMSDEDDQEYTSLQMFLAATGEYFK